MEYTLIQKIEILRDIYNNIKQKVKKIKKTMETLWATKKEKCKP